MEGYIEKQAALDLIESATAWRMSTNQLYDEMKGLPVADVAPVVHARWRPSVIYASAIKCGACGEDIFLDDPYQHEEWSYCPLCGAKMDLDG